MAVRYGLMPTPNIPLPSLPPALRGALALTYPPSDHLATAPYQLAGAPPRFIAGGPTLPPAPVITAVAGLTMGRKVTIATPSGTGGLPILNVYVVDTNGGSQGYKSTSAVGATLHPSLIQFLRPDWNGNDSFQAYVANALGWSGASAVVGSADQLVASPPLSISTEPWFMYQGSPINMNGDFSQPSGSGAQYPTIPDTSSFITIDYFNQDVARPTGGGAYNIKLSPPVLGAFEPCINGHTIDWSTKNYWSGCVYPTASGLAFDIKLETAGDAVTTNNVTVGQGTNSAYVNGGTTGGNFIAGQWNVWNIPTSALAPTNSTMYKYLIVMHTGSPVGLGNPFYLNNLCVTTTQQTV
jgi:hypothetical protein